LAIGDSFAKEETTLEELEVPIVLPSLLEMNLEETEFTQARYMTTRFSYPQLWNLTSVLEGEELNQINLLLKKSAPTSRIMIADLTEAQRLYH